MIEATSALYRRIAPLFAPDTEATPAVNVMAVAVPKVTGVPEALVTVGL